MSRLRSLRIAVVAMLLLAADAYASNGEWERIQTDFRTEMLTLSGRLSGGWHPDLPAPGAPAASTGAVRVVVVGFTGGLEPKGYPDSGIAAVIRRVGGMGGEGVVALLFGHGEWRQAAERVIEMARSSPDSTGRLRPLLIVACGHSLGAVSMGKFALLLGQSGLDVSLAVYIDAFSAEKPKVPANVRCAINFYQRAGIFRGLPVRGKAGLAAAEPGRTTLLGNYRLTPRDKPPKTRARLNRRLFFEQHYRLAHDARVQGYICEAVRILLRLPADEGYATSK